MLPFCYGFILFSIFFAEIQKNINACLEGLSKQEKVNKPNRQKLKGQRNEK